MSINTEAIKAEHNLDEIAKLLLSGEVEDEIKVIDFLRENPASIPDLIQILSEDNKNEPGVVLSELGKLLEIALRR